ncbi:MAG TPA: HD domain-containing phosphohydrolase [Dermatophilaceae bacterium]|nr:HD domain-containing phosphohydrolase [Dermatophilaceae bacterium]
MNRWWLSRRTAKAYLAGGLALASLAVVVMDGRLASAWSTDGLILGGFLLACVVGEQLRLQLPGRMPTAPLASAVGLAMAMTSILPSGVTPSYGAGSCVLVAALGMAIGVTPQRQDSREDRATTTLDALLRLFSVAFAAVIMRTTLIPGQWSLAQTSAQWRGWQRALLLIVVAGSVVLVETPLRSIPRAATEHTKFGQAARDEFRAAFGLGTTITITGTLIAICIPALGMIAVPLMMLPLGLTQFALRRHTATRETYRQSVGALSRMPEAVGFIPVGHAERVARLAVTVGRELGMPERDVQELEYAALLHDIGQVTLRHPIPHGATVQAATSDQQRIADDGAEIVRATGVLTLVAEILAKQAVPYHRVVQQAERLPMASRIIKVVNAFTDLSSVHPAHTGDRSGTVVAMERIYLGLGYEYDPDVVAALENVLARAE